MITVAIWDNDTPEEILERITLALIEVGIKVEHIRASLESDPGCLMFEFAYAERLGEEG
jgi:hypothetical protein